MLDHIPQTMELARTAAVAMPEPNSLQSTPFPRLARRQFCRIGALSVVYGCLRPLAGPLRASADSSVEPRGGADCVIFLNLVGGPSQMDTFDVKELAPTPEDLDIRTTHLGYQWPYGLLPGLGEMLDDVLVVRSMAAWETLHNLGQYYVQVGHQFNPARVRELPSIGSVIAYEFLSRGKESDFLPPFISMNYPAGAVNGTLIRQGYLPSSAAPLTLDMRSGGNMPFLLEEDYKPRFNRRLDFLRSFDTSRRMADDGVAEELREWDAFSRSAERMIKSPRIADVFTLDEEDRKRYGDSPFGDGCLVARNLVAAEAGARYILVSQSGWDHHGDIYGKASDALMEDRRARGGLYKNCGELDPAMAALLSDLKRIKSSNGGSLLDRTFVVAAGEFGRTPGELTDIKGRDHWPAVRCGLFAGAGVVPGRALGATNGEGGSITRYDWSQQRPIYPEDVTATMYSVLGIDWTKKIGGTPSGREFQYVEPMSGTRFIGSTEVQEFFS